LGNTLGGRLAAGRSAHGALAIALAFGGVWIAAVAFLSPALAHALSPGAGSGGSAVVLASLLATVLLFGVPMLALGVASPMLVARLSPLRGAGRAAGSILLGGTLGS